MCTQRGLAVRNADAARRNAPEARSQTGAAGSCAATATRNTGAAGSNTPTAVTNTGTGGANTVACGSNTPSAGDNTPEARPSLADLSVVRTLIEAARMVGIDMGRICRLTVNLALSGSGTGVPPVVRRNLQTWARCPCHSAGQQSASRTLPTIGRCAHRHVIIRNFLATVFSWSIVGRYGVDCPVREGSRD